MTSVATVHVGLDARAYDIHVGDGLLARAGDLVRPFVRRSRVVVVTDENVARLHLPTLSTAIATADIVVAPLIIAPGEDQKSFAGLERLSTALLDLEVGRDDVIIAFGGGVIGDLTGLAAGLLKRGIDYIQIPTTLLSQVDSSVGGKTAINVAQGKNLIGLFHQPRLVIADVGLLRTLPSREMSSGYAEVQKYGLLGDAIFFEWCEKNVGALLACQTHALVHAVSHSCRMKAAIVVEDEREQGRRALLNLGHTFGHALEAETGYSDRLLHGEAVAVGCALAFSLSADLGMVSRADVARVFRHLSTAKLPVRIADIAGLATTPEKLIAHMRHDKKAGDGAMKFILARAIGDTFVSRDVPIAALVDVLAASMK